MVLKKEINNFLRINAIAKFTSIDGEERAFQGRFDSVVLV